MRIVTSTSMKNCLGELADAAPVNEIVATKFHRPFVISTAVEVDGRPVSESPRGSSHKTVTTAPSKA
jgi:hypothetical protein